MIYNLIISICHFHRCTYMCTSAERLTKDTHLFFRSLRHSSCCMAGMERRLTYAVDPRKDSTRENGVFLSVLKYHKYAI